MAVHGIRAADSVAAAGTARAEVRLEGVWYVHSVSIQNEDAAALEPGVVKIQFGQDTYNGGAEWHPLEVGDCGPNTCIFHRFEQTVRGTVLFVGEVVHAGAVSHRLTVLAWKVGDR